MIKIKQILAITLLALTMSALSFNSVEAYRGLINQSNTIEIEGSEFIGKKKLSAGPIVDIGIGNGHFIALTDSGRVYTWGDNLRYQLGSGDQKYYDESSPYDITNKFYNQEATEDGELNIEKIKSVTAGGNMSFALTAKTGRVYYWGNDITRPIKMMGLHGQTVTQIVADQRDATSLLLLTDKGLVYYWQIGQNNNQARPIYGFDQHSIKQINISPWRDSMIALTDDNEVYIWTSKTKPTLMTETLVNKLQDERYSNLITSIAAGELYSENDQLQYYMASSDDFIDIWTKENDVRDIPKPSQSDELKIRQVLTDGFNGHYILTDDGIYLLYDMNNPYIKMAGLDKDKRVVKIFNNSPQKRGRVIALTDNGELYDVGVQTVSRLSPELFYLPDGAKDEEMITGITVGDKNAIFSIKNDHLISLVVPTSDKAGVVPIIATDVYGQTHYIGDYEYFKTIDPGQTNDKKDHEDKKDNSQDKSKTNNKPKDQPSNQKDSKLIKDNKSPKSILDNTKPKLDKKPLLSNPKLLTNRIVAPNTGYYHK